MHQQQQHHQQVETVQIWVQSILDHGSAKVKLKMVLKMVACAQLFATMDSSLDFPTQNMVFITVNVLMEMIADGSNHMESWQKRKSRNLIWWQLFHRLHGTLHSSLANQLFQHVLSLNINLIKSVLKFQILKTAFSDVQKDMQMDLDVSSLAIKASLQLHCRDIKPSCFMIHKLWEWLEYYKS